MNTRREEGQILVLFAAALIVLMGFSALVVDVGLNYASERRYQAVADAASLAGAQELQPATRSAPVTADMQTNARTRALQAVVDELLGPGTTVACDPLINIVDCDLPGGRYRASILTPSPTCVTCVPERAVQVTVSEPEFSTTFARVLGQSTWELTRSSVAGLSFGRNYTIVTLRPPKPLGSSSSFDVRDIILNGNNTKVRVQRGDVATNSNMKYDGVGALMELDPGYEMYYYDPYNPPEWGTNPVGTKLPSMVEDPNYNIPSPPGSAGSLDTDEAVGSVCRTAAQTLYDDPGYTAYVPEVGSAPDMDKIDCYTAGRYASDLTIDNGNLAILEPGLYWFDNRLRVQGSLIGGFAPGSEGVALVFARGAEFTGRTSGGGTDPSAIALNAGTRFPDRDGEESAPALDGAGNPIVTNTTPSLKLTVMVQKQPLCGPTTPDCAATDVVDLAGNSDLFLAGVQYMPTDEPKIAGGSAGSGYVGQIWAWTLFYTGNSTINQEGLGVDGVGTIRIDTACSPGTACN